MKRILFLLLLMPLALLSQNLPFVSGGKSMGLGGNSLAISDVWSINNNQAGLGFQKDMEVGVYYTNRFLIKELSSQSLVFALPSRIGNWGVSVEHFGYSEYSEMQIGLAYAKSLSPFVSLGIKFDYLQVHQPEYYGDARAVLVELGVQAKPQEDITIGAHVYNPSLSKFNTAIEQKVPTVFGAGIAYQIEPMVALMAQIDKNYKANATYKFGVEMNLKEKLYIRAGANINPNAYALGLAYYFKNIKFDLAFTYQNVLGLSPASSFGYVFRKGQN